jgi:hypothetical protein
LGQGRASLCAQAVHGKAERTVRAGQGAHPFRASRQGKARQGMAPMQCWIRQGF